MGVHAQGTEENQANVDEAHLTWDARTMTRSMRPASESTEQEIFLARWYETFLDACKMAKRRNLGLVTHPKNKAALMDMMERVYEDDLWNMGDLPPLMTHPSCPEGEYRFVHSETLEMVKAAAANQSRTGIGRFDTLWTPDATLKRRD